MPQDKASKTANAVAGKVGILSARVLHAAIEGCAYVCTVPGFRTVLAVHGIAICYYLGPSRTASLTMKCAIACAGYKFCEVLINNEPAESEQENLNSVWEWTPPGELGGSGAWTVVRELALTLSRVNEEFPELRELQPLPVTELARRLCHLFTKCVREPPAADLGDAQGRKPVMEELLRKLAGYLYLVDQSYEGATEAQLSRRLQRKGYALNYVKPTATWADHQPAFFMATHADSCKVVVAVRGTAQLEDVVTDLTALPEVFGDTGMLAHSGMQRAALWLFERLSSLLRDELSPELQAVTRIVGALQAMQQMRLPAALGGSPAEAAQPDSGAGQGVRRVQQALGCGNLTREAERAEEEEATKGSGKGDADCKEEQGGDAEHGSSAQPDSKAWKMEKGAEDEEGEGVGGGGQTPGGGSAREVAEEVADRTESETQR